eukprot:11370.XXX_634399_634584_1 [CDS] Oithona nana genome sequencing.
MRILMTPVGLAPQSNCRLHKTMNSLKRRGTLGSFSSDKLKWRNQSVNVDSSRLCSSAMDRH